MRNLKPFILVLAVFASACSLPNVFKTVEESGGDAVDQAYALVAVFNEVDASALALAEKSETPQEVKDTLKKLRGPAAASVPLIAEAAVTAREALNNVAKAEAAGETTDTATAVAAVQALQSRYDRYAPAIQSFIDYVNTL